MTILVVMMVVVMKIIIINRHVVAVHRVEQSSAGLEEPDPIEVGGQNCTTHGDAKSRMAPPWRMAQWDSSPRSGEYTKSRKKMRPLGRLIG